MKKGKSYVRQQTFNRTVNETTNDIAALIANKVDKEAGKGLSVNDYSDIEKAKVANGGMIAIDTIPLIPVQAKAEIAYGAETFTITALAKGVLGNGIAVHFVNSGNNNELLDVTASADPPVITVIHATDESGIISTAAGNLVTAINTHEVAGTLVLASMGNAGTFDSIATQSLSGGVDGIVCNKHQLLTDDTNIYIALKDLDGSINETTDFKKVALSAI